MRGPTRMRTIIEADVHVCKLLVDSGVHLNQQTPIEVAWQVFLCILAPAQVPTSIAPCRLPRLSLPPKLYYLGARPE